jgi:hypothetical protein
MARIEVTGWVSDWKYQTSEPNPDWGMKLNESHSKKNDAGGWEVVGNTRYTIKAAYGVQIDFRNFKSGDRVLVKGTQVTEERGEYKNLVVKAESVEVLATSARAAGGAKPQLVEDAPF